MNIKIHLWDGSNLECTSLTITGGKLIVLDKEIEVKQIHTINFGNHSLVDYSGIRYLSSNY